MTNYNLQLAVDWSVCVLFEYMFCKIVSFHEKINSKELEDDSVFPSPTLINSMLGKSTNHLSMELFLSWEGCLLKDTDLGSRFHVTK